MLGGNTANQVFPFFLEDNSLYYDSNASTQLRLFGNTCIMDLVMLLIDICMLIGLKIFKTPWELYVIDFSAACDADQIKLKLNDNNDASALNVRNKRSSESVDIITQNNLQISFTNLFRDETHGSRSIPQVNTVSTGLRLSYDDEERHSSVTTASESMSSLAFTPAVFDYLGPEIELQNAEFNRYLRFQEEQLAKGLREMKQRHAASFINIIDQELSRKLRAKDLEIELMNRKNHELADQIRQAAAEAQTWQQRAQYNESIVHALRSSLQQTIAQGAAAAAAAANQGREGCGESEVDDAASSFYPNSFKDGRKHTLTIACKGCKGRESCMLLLPCRHLCLCRDCDAMVEACPACFTRKTASVEVYMS
ncbi:hypothetical protein KFK09_004019 [Dendrobium nobile]|uniref:RING-type domain-containing protein n=1 Tax=Dendrobium nobile TaxID=94219 RepID=A0A8T3BZ70_DENNO|nr:hypothetical protein KFK09_004019 [Dendrobium nobile]